MGDGHRFAHGHGRAYPDAHVAAALGEVLGGDVVCAAEHELHVGVVDDLGPEVVRVAVLELAEALHGLILQHLQPRAEAEHNAGAHRVAGLSEQVVRRAGRVIERQLLKERRKLALAVANEHLVDRGEVFLVRRPAWVESDVEYERLEQVGFAVIPEVVALALSMLIKEILGSECHFMRARKKTYSKS